ncbi:hypothetical protein F2Q68_00002111 [Brassica cretica]|uniref:Uncharacterized protein n=1 Tax=Brassica cretica TaxID=69181 RepID=A0A8S9JC53_BRACR|nr:hypothetical protein F2Q68_00002111 [Brassica cretica]
MAGFLGQALGPSSLFGRHGGGVQSLSNSKSPVHKWEMKSKREFVRVGPENKDFGETFFLDKRDGVQKLVQCRTTLISIHFAKKTLNSNRMLVFSEKWNHRPYEGGKWCPRPNRPNDDVVFWANEDGIVVVDDAEENTTGARGAEENNTGARGTKENTTRSRGAEE